MGNWPRSVGSPTYALQNRRLWFHSLTTRYDRSAQSGGTVACGRARITTGRGPEPRRYPFGRHSAAPNCIGPDDRLIWISYDRPMSLGDTVADRCTPLTTRYPTCPTAFSDDPWGHPTDYRTGRTASP